MNRLDAMATFVRVAELGSFAGVADQSGVARSVITRQVAALEDHLGVKLMVRTTRRLTLTSAGRSYLEKCRSILEMVDTAEAEVMEDRLTPRGRLRVSLPLSFSLKRLVPLMLEFSQAYPLIHLSMDFTDRRVNLIDEGFDLSIRITSRLEPGEIVRKLGSCKMLTFASPDYLAAHGRPRHPADLSKHACLGYAPLTTDQPWLFSIDGKVERFFLNHRLSANNGEALAEAAARGLGIAMQPDFIAQGYLDAGRVEAVLKKFAQPELGIYAVLPSNRYLPHRVRLLIELLSKSLSRPA